MLWIDTSKFRQTEPFPDSVTGTCSLKCSKFVRDLDIVIDDNLTFKRHMKTFVNLLPSEFSNFEKLGN